MDTFECSLIVFARLCRFLGLACASRSPKLFLGVLEAVAVIVNHNIRAKASWISIVSFVYTFTFLVCV